MGIVVCWAFMFIGRLYFDSIEEEAIRIEESTLGALFCIVVLTTGAIVSAAAAFIWIMLELTFRIKKNFKLPLEASKTETFPIMPDQRRQ